MVAESSSLERQKRRARTERRREFYVVYTYAGVLEMEMRKLVLEMVNKRRLERICLFAYCFVVIKGSFGKLFVKVKCGDNNVTLGHVGWAFFFGILWALELNYIHVRLSERIYFVVSSRRILSWDFFFFSTDEMFL